MALPIAALADFVAGGLFIVRNIGDMPAVRICTRPGCCANNVFPDEHTAALDPKTARQIFSLTQTRVREQHLATLMITHNMNHALKKGPAAV